jgi:uncharacterized protein with gpF-like domain
MITLPSIPPNSAIESFYRRSMDDMMRDMRKDIKTSIIARYRSELAMDGIIDWMGHIVDSIVDKWTKNLDLISVDIANDVVGRTRKNYDKRIHALLKRRGMIVNLQMSRKVEEQAKIAIEENTALIKSIGTQYLDKVRSAVWRSVKNGYDLESLTEQLSQIDGVERRRAKNIASDQVGKYNQAVEDARAQELGITRAIWLHSGASKVPRPSHVKANGVEYELEKGLYLDGEWTHPRQRIGCKCGKRLVINLTPQKQLQL